MLYGQRSISMWKILSRIYKKKKKKKWESSLVDRPTKLTEKSLKQFYSII